MSEPVHSATQVHVSDRLAEAVFREAERSVYDLIRDSPTLMLAVLRELKQITPEVFALDNPADHLMWVIAGDQATSNHSKPSTAQKATEGSGTNESTESKKAVGGGIRA